MNQIFLQTFPLTHRAAVTRGVGTRGNRESVRAACHRRKTKHSRTLEMWNWTFFHTFLTSARTCLEFDHLVHFNPPQRAGEKSADLANRIFLTQNWDVKLIYCANVSKCVITQIQLQISVKRDFFLPFPFQNWSLAAYQQTLRPHSNSSVS